MDSRKYLTRYIAIASISLAAMTYTPNSNADPQNTKTGPQLGNLIKEFVKKGSEVFYMYTPRLIKAVKGDLRERRERKRLEKAEKTLEEEVMEVEYQTKVEPEIKVVYNIFGENKTREEREHYAKSGGDRPFARRK